MKAEVWTPFSGSGADTTKHFDVRPQCDNTGLGSNPTADKTRSANGDCSAISENVATHAAIGP